MRLIDADRLKRVLIAFFTGSHLELPHISKVIDFLDNADTIDAEPVRHGHWEHDSTGANFCSECLEYPYDDGEYHMVWHCSYCPNCGAKMDEVSE